LLIPRIFHQIWFGPEPLPEEYDAYQKTWLCHHPDWALRVWTEKNLPKPGTLRRPEAHERLRTPWERSDIFRLEVLWRFGGVYVDVDFKSLRSIEPLIKDTDFFIGVGKRGHVNSALFGASAGHPILDRALDEIRPREFPGYDGAATGSRFLGRLLADEPRVTFIDREYFYPQKQAQVEKAYAVHEPEAWDTLEELWKSLLKGERRMKAAQEEARRWRAKYREVQAKGRPRERRRPGRDRIRPTRRSVLIPRIFHQIWLGPEPLPEEYVAYQKTWVRHHPGWELRLWVEENLPDRLRRPESAERLRSPAERADILRLELLWRFGGVYVDTDLECLRSIEELIDNTDFFTVLRRSGVVDTFLLGAIAGHPILDRGLDEIRPRRTFGALSKGRTGPRFLDNLLADSKSRVTLLEPRRLDGYAVHHKHRTYLGAEVVRADMLRAKREMQAAREEIRKWRARANEAVAEGATSGEVRQR
jgi:inositol phosphorylceramide mannosyltransferase catalytic subunit